MFYDTQYILSKKQVKRVKMDKKQKINRKIAKYLKKKRKRVLMTRLDVSEKTKLHTNTIKNIEEAKGGMNLHTLYILCECYGITLRRMFKFLKM